MSIILRIFPNGEVSQGVSLPKRPSGSKIRERSPGQQLIDKKHLAAWNAYQVKHPEINLTEISTPGAQFLNSRGELYTLFDIEQGKAIYGWECVDGKGYISSMDMLPSYLITLEGMSYLGLSDARILDSPKPSRKKLVSMTSNMSRNIRNAVHILEEQYGKDQLSFLTLTLPDLSRDGLALCCANWDTMVNLFTKWLRKQLASSLLDLEYVYCTEIQPGRLKNRGEYAPHLHIVFRGKAYKKQPWAVSWLECRNAWAAIISKFVSESFDTRALENIQRIKKSAARYLSKYMSKGKQCIPKENSENAPIQQLHTQWGGMSRSLSRLLRKLIIRMMGCAPHCLANRLYTNVYKLVEAGLIRYWKSRFIQTGRDKNDPNPRGITVSVGCLDRSVSLGGLTDCIAYVEKLELAA